MQQTSLASLAFIHKTSLADLHHIQDNRNPKQYQKYYTINIQHECEADLAFLTDHQSEKTARIYLVSKSAENNKYKHQAINNQICYNIQEADQTLVTDHHSQRHILKLYRFRTNRDQ